MALYSNIINTADVEKAIKQALSDVKHPIASQYYSSDRKSHFDQGKRMLMAVVWSSTSLLEKGARFGDLASVGQHLQNQQERHAIARARWRWQDVYTCQCFIVERIRRGLFIRLPARLTEALGQPCMRKSVSYLV